MADICNHLRPLLGDVSTKTALLNLRSDFLHADAIGPRRVAEFIYGREDLNLQADVAGFIRQLLTECSR